VDGIFNEIGDFEWTKNHILYKVFLVRLVAQYKISANVKNTLNFSMKQVYSKDQVYSIVQKCFISFYRLEISKYLSDMSN